MPSLLPTATIPAAIPAALQGGHGQDAARRHPECGSDAGLGFAVPQRLDQAHGDGTSIRNPLSVEHDTPEHGP